MIRAKASSSQSSPSVPSSSSQSWKYDVFLSFRGEDTRKTLVDHLYSALVERVTCTYKDDVTLSRGDTIGPSLFTAIEESQIAIIIFSENYANSSWCLDELAYIMECNKEGGKIVMPIFYHVDPSDVRKQEKKYGEAFVEHEKNYSYNKVKSWRKALFDAGNIAGWEINHNFNGYEAKCIKDIVGTVLDRLLYSNSVVDENLVGMGTRLQDLKSQLQIGSGGVRMLGIWGMGGGGKTTLASSLYNEISGTFDSCCFVENIKEESSMKTLQEKILSTVLKTEVKLESIDKGKQTIKTRLGCKKVLLILDDINDRKHIEALAGSHDWFGDGSRIIITCRDEQLLRTHRVDEISHVSLLSDDEAIRLFYRCAYNEGIPVKDYKTLSQRVVSYAAGLPLALIVLGSFLYDKNKEEWISTLDRLQDFPEMEIVNILKISFDGLTALEKELFLDIVCFYRVIKKEEAMEILDACGFHPVIGVKVLIQKALITINLYGQFEMHDLVEEMGHFIVRGGHPNNPEKHSRLWRFKEIDEMCSGNETTDNNKTEAIICPCSPSDFHKLVSKAKKLRFLSVTDYVIKEDIKAPEYLSNELRYIYWRGYPASPFPESFQLRKLVVLRLKCSLQTELWNGYKYLPCLKELHVGEAKHLVRAPDFGGLPCLEKLTIEDCPKLKRIEGNFHALKHLHKCKIKGCYIKQPIKLPKDLFHEHIHLEELHLDHTRQPSIPHLPCFLTRLTLKYCQLKDGEIPCDIGGLFNLQELDLSENDFSRLNFSLLQLTRLKLLNVDDCWNLIELPELPTSIAILEADNCMSLEFVGDIINKNCKWLSQVSLCKYGVGASNPTSSTINGGERLLETMLQGNAIENGCMYLRLGEVEMTKGLIIPGLVKGKRYRLELPDNWFIHFSGFLFSAVLRRHYGHSQTISMKHEKSGSTTGMDSVEKVYWKESKYDHELEETWVGYVSFGALKHTTWWHPTSTAIHFKIECDDELCDGFGVRLVPKTGSSELQTTTSDSSSQSSNHYYKPNFKIRHDSESHLKCTIGS